MKRLLVLCLVLLVATEASAGKQLVNLPLSSDLNDTKGNLTAGRIVRNSDATYVGTDGVLRYARGTRTNLVTRSDPANSTGLHAETENVSFTSYAWPSQPVAGLSNATVFGDNSVQRTVAHTYTGWTVNTAYLFSAYVIMDDLSTPVLGMSTTTGDFSLRLVGYISHSVSGVDHVGNNVYRVWCVYTHTSGSGTASIRKYTGQSSKGFKVSGFQLEALPSGNVIGPDTVTNGGFDSDTAWTKGTDWAISGGVATKTSGTASDLSQATTYPSGETVQVVFTLTRTAGTLTPKIGSVSGTAFSSSGTYTVYIKTAASSASLIFSADSSFAGTIDNVTARAVPDLAYLQPGTYTPTAGSTATIPAQPRFEANGLLIEGEATNYVLYSCDLTQTSAWTKSSTTAAKNQTGPSGTANEATLVTATANNGTILSTVTVDGSGSTNKTFSVWLKRITGTGNIQLTDNNGTNWTTVSVTSSWAKYALSARAQATPIVGIRLATSGDAVAVCGAQVELSAFSTSLIPTNGCPVTRLSEAGNNSPENGYRWTMSQSLKNILGAAVPSRGTMLVDYINLVAHTPTTGNRGFIGTTDSLSAFLRFTDNTQAVAFDGTNNASRWVTPPSNTWVKYALRWDSTANGGAGRMQLSSNIGGTWTHGVATNYDGSFVLTDHLRLAFGNEYAFWIKNVRFYDGWVKDENLNDPERAGMFPILPTFKKIKPYLY